MRWRIGLIVEIESVLKMVNNPAIIESSVDELKAEIEEIGHHPLFADVVDSDLGERKAGYFVKVIGEDNDGYTIFQIVLDNGHFYFVNGNSVVRGQDISAEMLIHKYLEKIVYDYVLQMPFPVSKDVYCAQNEVSVTSFIRMVIDRDLRIVNITNIFIPRDPEYQYHNYGKNLIALIYEQCKRLGYKLWLVDMVEGFYNRMIKRGATVIEENDIVEINDETDLKPRI